MKKPLLTLLFVVYTFGLFAQKVLPKPQPFRLVADAAHILSPEEQITLHRKLKALNDSTTIQIAVVTIPSLKGSEIERYANKLFNTWGIGQKDKNNGVLLLLAMKEHKIRIEVGKGLEEKIPNEKAAQIITDITPTLKFENYYEALDKATSSLAIAAQFGSDYKAPNSQNNYMPAMGAATTKTDNSSGRSAFFLSILAIFFLLFIIRYLFKMIARSCRPTLYDSNGYTNFNSNNSTWGSFNRSNNFSRNNYTTNNYRQERSYNNSDSSYSSQDSSSQDSSSGSSSNDGGGSYGGGSSNGSGASGSW